MELYNLKEDIGENNDISEKFPEITENLKNLLNSWRESMGAKLPKKNPTYIPG